MRNTIVRRVLCWALWPLRQAAAETRAKGVELQLRPLEFDPQSLGRLLDMGVHWYVADAPAAFAEAFLKAR